MISFSDTNDRRIPRHGSAARTLVSVTQESFERVDAIDGLPFAALTFRTNERSGAGVRESHPVDLVGIHISTFVFTLENELVKLGVLGICNFNARFAGHEAPEDCSGSRVSSVGHVVAEAVELPRQMNGHPTRSSGSQLPSL